MVGLPRAEPPAGLLRDKIVRSVTVNQPTQDIHFTALPRHLRLGHAGCWGGWLHGSRVRLPDRLSGCLPSRLPSLSGCLAARQGTAGCITACPGLPYARPRPPAGEQSKFGPTQVGGYQSRGSRLPLQNTSKTSADSARLWQDPSYPIPPPLLRTPWLSLRLRPRPGELAPHCASKNRKRSVELGGRQADFSVRLVPFTKHWTDYTHF